MSILLPKGTKEFLLALVTDNLGNVTTLDDVDVTFTVKDKNDDNVIEDQEATTDDMTVMCLVDTAGWTEGTYRLFITLDIEPQIPIFGPFRFDVESYDNDDADSPPIVT